MNYKQNKMAFGQARTPEKVKLYGRHQVKEREQRRRAEKALKMPKESVRKKEYKRMLEQAFELNKHIPELKYVQLKRDYLTVDLEHGVQYELVGFEEDENMWSSNYFKTVKVIVRVNEIKTVTVEKYILDPAEPSDEDMALYIIKRQIGL